MTTIPATEAKNKFGELLEKIHQEPVEIAKKGRPVAVVLSILDYQNMLKKIISIENGTSFTWLEEIRSKATDTSPATNKTLTKADYYTRLDEKYGS